MVKHTEVHPRHGIPLSREKEGNVDAGDSLNDAPKNYPECEKAIPPNFILYDSVHVTSLK